MLTSFFARHGMTTICTQESSYLKVASCVILHLRCNNARHLHNMLFADACPFPQYSYFLHNTVLHESVLRCILYMSTWYEFYVCMHLVYSGHDLEQQVIYDLICYDKTRHLMVKATLAEGQMMRFVGWKAILTLHGNDHMGPITAFWHNFESMMCFIPFPKVGYVK